MSVFRRFFAIAAYASLVSTASIELQAQEFVPGFEDVPLAPGMIVQESEVLVFDSPTGRIAETFATGAENWGKVAEFYRKSLEQLGWTLSGYSADGARFIREGETLTLDRFGDDGALTVRFTLAPSG